MATNNLNLSRNQLAAFLKDHESIRQFERLFSIANDIGPDGLNEVQVEAGTANAKAEAALTALQRIADALEMLATAPATEHNNSVVTDYIDFQKFASAPVPAVGRMRWNDQDGTVDVGLKGGNVTLQIGQEQLIYAVNKTGADLLEANYQCVRISGAQGQRPKVALAQANNDANSGDTIGLVTETIANNLEGFVTTSGIVRNIDTTGTLQSETWADGDVLYLSGTTAGRVTNIKPSAPTHTVIVGFVIHAHSTQGKIFVKVDNGYEIDELHNVLITPSVLAGSLLIYDATTAVWKNARLTAGSNIAITNADGSITVATAAAITSALTNNTGRLIDSSATLSNGAAAATGTLTNAPAAGNPTKWVAINDNGTTRYIPAW